MKMQLSARAKINLALDVTARRPDGYHELRMIMQSIDLADGITLERTDEPGITFRCTDPALPTDSSNHAVRAAELLFEAKEIPGGLRIELKKRIPVAAGLAGGSTDAAAVLRGINEICGLGLSEQELTAFGLRIGADVPYCLLGGTALAEGIGEILTPLPAIPDQPILLAKPDVQVHTGQVYGALKLDEQIIHPDVDGMIEAIRRADQTGIASRLGNVLETVTVPLHPIISEIKEEMRACGAAGVLMSGSGPSVFGLFEKECRASEAEERIREKGLAEVVLLTRPTGRREKES